MSSVSVDVSDSKPMDSPKLDCLNCRMFGHNGLAWGEISVEAHHSNDEKHLLISSARSPIRSSGSSIILHMLTAAPLLRSVCGRCGSFSMVHVFALSSGTSLFILFKNSTECDSIANCGRGDAAKNKTMLLSLSRTTSPYRILSAGGPLADPNTNIT